MNSGRPQIQFLLVLLRTAQKVRSSTPITRFLLAAPSSAVYRMYSLFLCGVDIPVSTHIGPGLQIHHGQALVVHNEAIIGPNCVLRQSVTIGTSISGGLAPKLAGDNDIGAGAIIIGDVLLGEGSTVGAGAVVTRNVPKGSTVVGNPARITGAG